MLAILSQRLNVWNLERVVVNNTHATDDLIVCGSVRYLQIRALIARLALVLTVFLIRLVLRSKKIHIFCRIRAFLMLILPVG